MLLDLSAAFDTVDHSVLLYRLENRFNIRDKAFSCFKSYLSNRSQSVIVNRDYSSSHDIVYGVPQGSVLGPTLYLLYTSPLGDIIRKHDMEFHSYADDSKIYFSFDSATPNCSFL